MMRKKPTATKTPVNAGSASNQIINTNSTLTPTTPEAKLTNLRVAMSKLKARYPVTKPHNMQFETSVIKGNMRHCKFYISDGIDTTGMAFRSAYKAATRSENNKLLCTSVGSMMCAVSGGLRNSVDLALNRIGVKPGDVSLPAKDTRLVLCRDRTPNTTVSEVPEMDWPYILVIFGCCILLLFQNNTSDESYKAYMSKCIRELQGSAGYDPASADIDVPFDFTRAKAIRTMLGANSILRETVMCYIMSNIYKGDSGTGGLCQCLINILSWSEMHQFTVMNEMLVKPQSPVLNDPRVSEEVANWSEACEVVASHPYPQFFMHLASYVELMKVECSRFPTLIAVAQELERGGDGSSVVVTSMAGAELTTVQALVKLHLTSMTC